MPTPRELALDHYRQRQTFVDATAEVAAQMWSQVDPDRVADSWAQQIPELTAVVTGAQLGVARQADPYLSSVVDAEDLDDELAGLVDPAGFAGVASDGRGLATLLANPIVVTLLAVQDGIDITRALAGGAHNLDMLVRTQVADAGRAADQAALTARPGVDGYVRVAVGATCSRCLILAGRFYRWNTGFQRHPRCDCIHLPAGAATAAALRQNPRAIYDSLSARERQRAGWSLTDQRAIADGADLNQVTNMRGVTTAGNRRYVGRPTPDDIYRAAGDDRDKAIRLLRENGYVKGVPAVSRSRLTTAAAEPAPGAVGRSSGFGPRPLPPPPIRPELEAGRTTAAVERIFRAEFERITGRRLQLLTLPRSAATARETAEGLLRGVERFPDVDLRQVRVYHSGHPNAYAIADSGHRSIEFNDAMTSPAGRQSSLDSLATDESNRWHPAGTGNWTAVAVHEFGHALDISTLGESIRDDLDALLVRRAAERDARLDADKAAGLFLEIEDFVAGRGVEGVINREVSRYASKNRRELVAEAFSDVLMNGGAASQLSREIFELVEAAYLRGGRRAARAGVISASEAAPDLDRMTVPQLRALAKARGMKGYSKMRKAELVDALRTTPVPVPTSTVRPPTGRPSSGAPSWSDIYDELARQHADLRPGMRRKVKSEVIGRWLDGDYAGLQVKVTRVDFSPIFGIGYSGVIKDSAGRKVGQFSRVVNRDRAGQMYANHELLKIGRQFQGSGFQAAFNGDLIAWYRRSGLGYVKVGANIDVGGYTWARAGYDFRDQGSALDLMSRLHNQLAEIRGEPLRAFDWLDEGNTQPGWTWNGQVVFPAKPAWTKAKLRTAFRGASDEEIDRQLALAQEFLDGLPGKTFGQDLPSAYELSQLGRWDGAGKDDVWVGKLVMLGSAWLGILRL